jgi:hypothetical protein
MVHRLVGKNGISTMEWPAYSPDLNPIEHLWYHLKKKAIKMHPELSEMGHSSDDLEALIAASKEAWLALPQELLDTLVMSVEKRLKAVRKAKGWYTKY